MGYEIIITIQMYNLKIHSDVMNKSLSLVRSSNNDIKIEDKNLLFAVCDTFNDFNKFIYNVKFEEELYLKIKFYLNFKHEILNNNKKFNRRMYFNMIEYLSDVPYASYQIFLWGFEIAKYNELFVKDMCKFVKKDNLPECLKNMFIIHLRTVAYDI